MNKQTFEDLENQQQKENVFDPLGLYTVLKNIQTRQCSIGYLCIEIGSIYGDFNLLNAQKIKVDTTEKENVHLIIQPIVIQKKAAPAPAPAPAPQNHQQNHPNPGNYQPEGNKKEDKIKIHNDELEDCDFFSGHMDSLRFKVKLDKFY
jgi:hypothetical protein